MFKNYLLLTSILSLTTIVNSTTQAGKIKGDDSPEASRRVYLMSSQNIKEKYSSNRSKKSRKVKTKPMEISPEKVPSIEELENSLQNLKLDETVITTKTTVGKKTGVSGKLKSRIKVMNPHLQRVKKKLEFIK
jgi:hypothetical protein